MKRLALAFFCLVMAFPAWAAGNEAIEERMMGIASELRCLVCQNESIAASRAELAVDLRQQVRALIRDGKSDDEVRAYMVDRYGDFILYRTPLKLTTILLWFGPFLLLFAGLLIFALTLRNRQRRMTDESLSEEERQRADALLSKPQNILDKS